MNAFWGEAPARALLDQRGVGCLQVSETAQILRDGAVRLQLQRDPRPGQHAGIDGIGLARVPVASAKQRAPLAG